MADVVGYARVSTRSQSVDSQVDKLQAAGVHRIFVDVGESSRVRDRPQWKACLDYLRKGDTLMVCRLDRLAGSEKMAIETINDLGERGINLKSLTEPEIDTTSPMGRALFGIVAVFAQLRVDTIRENTMRGLEYARSQGRVGGRPRVVTPQKMEAIKAMRANGDSWRTIGAGLSISPSTAFKAYKDYEEERESESAISHDASKSAGANEASGQK